MAKRTKNDPADFETVISDKFRTTPITETIRKVKGLPASAILYKCAASSNWQFRVYLEGKQRKRTTKEEELAKAERAAKLIYAEMLQSVHSGQIKAKPSSTKTLQVVADTLWSRNTTRTKNGELNDQKVRNDRYVYERHIKPFFANTDVKKIDADLLEDFKTYLANKDLRPSTQVSYIGIVMQLLKQAQVKNYVTHVPLKPNVRVDDEARGYFDDPDYEKLIKAAKAAVGQKYEFKTKDGTVYRRISITGELPLLIEFMVNTYVRPTDIRVLRHKHVHEVAVQGAKFIELRHPATKRHNNHMLGSEQSLFFYKLVKSFQEKHSTATDQDFLFEPGLPNRETALDKLATQFTAVLEMAGLRKDDEGKPRTLYSLRHTAIVRSIRKGLAIELIAANSRTSSEMIRRFYGSHVKSVRHMGTAFVDKELVAREQRIEQLKAKFDMTPPPPESLFDD